MESSPVRGPAAIEIVGPEPGDACSASPELLEAVRDPEAHRNAYDLAWSEASFSGRRKDPASWSVSASFEK